MKPTFAAVATTLLGLAATIAEAACPTVADTALMAARYAERQPAPNPPDRLSLADAQCGRDTFTRLLAQRHGKVVGYKAGLTNPAVQQRFKHPSPVRGTLFEAMLLEDGATLPAAFGARPLFEADVVVEVKDAGIHRARTPLEALRHLSRLYPFIELPDLVVEDPKRLKGPGVVSINVGARFGVLGPPVELQATPAMVDALAAMTVRLEDGEGQLLDSGTGAAILGHPLNAVLWLAKDLQASGITLKQGDLLSLGSFSRLLPPRPGLRVRAVYEGLPGTPSVGVGFR